MYVTLPGLALPEYELFIFTTTNERTPDMGMNLCKTYKSLYWEIRANSQFSLLTKHTK